MWWGHICHSMLSEKAYCSNVGGCTYLFLISHKCMCGSRFFSFWVFFCFVLKSPEHQGRWGRRSQSALPGMALSQSAGRRPADDLRVESLQQSFLVSFSDTARLSVCENEHRLTDVKLNLDYTRFVTDHPRFNPPWQVLMSSFGADVWARLWIRKAFRFSHKSLGLIWAILNDNLGLKAGFYS